MGGLLTETNELDTYLSQVSEKGNRARAVQYLGWVEMASSQLWGTQNNNVVVYNYSRYGRGGDRVFGMEAANGCNVKFFRASRRASR